METKWLHGGKRVQLSSCVCFLPLISKKRPMCAVCSQHTHTHTYTQAAGIESAVRYEVVWLCSVLSCSVAVGELRCTAQHFLQKAFVRFYFPHYTALRTSFHLQNMERSFLTPTARCSPHSSLHWLVRDCTHTSGAAVFGSDAQYYQYWPILVLKFVIGYRRQYNNQKKNKKRGCCFLD